MDDVTQHVVVKWNGPSMGSKCSHDQWDRYTCKQVQNRKHHSPSTVACTHMHQCSRMEPWRKNMGSKHTKYLSIRPMQSSILEPMHLQRCKFKRNTRKEKSVIKEKKEKNQGDIKTNIGCATFLVVLLGGFWNSMLLETERKLLLGRNTEVN